MEYTRELSFVSLSRFMHWQSLKIAFTLHGRILLEHKSGRNTSFFFLFADFPRTSSPTPLRNHRVIIIKSLILLLHSIELLKKNILCTIEILTRVFFLKRNANIKTKLWTLQRKWFQKIEHHQ